MPPETPKDPLALGTVFAQAFKILAQHFFKFLLIFLLAASAHIITYMLDTGRFSMEYIGSFPNYLNHYTWLMPTTLIFILFATTAITPFIIDKHPKPSLIKTLILSLKHSIFLIMLFILICLRRIPIIALSICFYFIIINVAFASKNEFSFFFLFTIIITHILTMTAPFFLIFTTSIIEKSPPVTSLRNTYNLIENHRSEIYFLFAFLAFSISISFLIIGYNIDAPHKKYLYAFFIPFPLLYFILASILAIIIHTTLTAQKTAYETKEILATFD